MKCEAVLSLSIAFAAFALFSPQSAQARTTENMATPNSASSSAMARQEAMLMVPAQVSLEHEIDAQKIHSGYKFQATLRSTVHLKNGPELPRGTVLMGTVASDRMQAGGTSTLALRFTQAKLKSGRLVPIKATIVGVSAPPEPLNGYYSYSDASLWTPKTLRVDIIGAESGVNLHSRIAGRNSGVFVTTKKDNVTLRAGSRISLAIAARKLSHQNNAAMRSGA